jgi:hypothetical protein
MLRRYDGSAFCGAFLVRKAFVTSALLLLSGTVLAREKAESLLFVFLRVDHEQDIAILRPMIAPDIGVQLDSGPRHLAPGTVLTCEMLSREHDAIVEGQVARLSEIVLDCGDHKFVVKTLDFRPQRK